MEIVEMYCDLLLARFGLVESMKLVLFPFKLKEIILIINFVQKKGIRYGFI